MSDGLYERDFMLWSEAQADLLRRLASGERVNAAVDWANLIEEVEDLGKSEFNAFESLVLQAFIHILKCRAWPGSSAHRHWLGETNVFLANARRRFTPSMRQKVNLAELYRDALKTVRLNDDNSGSPLTLPDECPFGLDQILKGDVATFQDAGG